MARRKRPRPRAARRGAPTVKLPPRAIKDLTHRQCLVFGQLANRVEWAALQAYREFGNGKKMDLESVRHGLDVAVSEAERMGLMIPKTGKAAAGVGQFAKTLSSELKGKATLSDAERKKLKGRASKLLDDARNLMDAGESACPL